MKTLVSLIVVLFLFASCENKEEEKLRNNNFESRIAKKEEIGKLVQGKTYLPLYSHIYHIHEHRTIDLAITVSIRNTSLTDSMYILKADYFNTNGNKIREYIQSPIYVKPMETIEFIISESDKEGGSGANFMFDWAVNDSTNHPLFEAVMISTYGQQGISFTTQGVNRFNQI